MANEGTNNTPFLRCSHCGLLHLTTCPRIRSIEYHPDGTVKRIEFHEPRFASVSPTPAPPDARRPKS